MNEQNSVYVADFADSIRSRLQKDSPDYEALSAECLGAQRMAIALGDPEAAGVAARLGHKVTAAWREESQS